MLKTYNARTMADALAQVKRDLGRDAVIVHTRSFRVGGVLGFGGRPMVEVTATTGAAAGEHAPRRVSTRAVGRVPVSPRGEDTENPLASLASSIVTKPVRPAARPAEPETAPIGVESGVGGPAPESPGEALQRVATHPQAESHSQPEHPTATRPPEPGRDHPADRGLATAPEPNGLGPDALRGALDRAATLLAQRAARRDEPAAPAPTHQSPQPDHFAPTPSEPEPAEPDPDRGPAPDQSPLRLREAPPRPESELEAKPTSPERHAALEQEIGDLRRMMGQVLQSTRRAEARSGGPGSFGGATPEPLLDLYTKLTDAEVNADEAESIVGEVRDELGPDELRDERIVRETALRRLERRLPTKVEAPSGRGESGRPSVIALIGPTGVGKTTTVAKLAATYKLRHAKRVGLITTDTYRIAAVEQLRTYAGIIGLPLKVAMTPADVAAAVESLSDCDVIVMDTAGRSQNDAKRLDELRSFLGAAKPDQTHMVLSTTVGRKVLERTVERFGALGPDRAVLTKLDEAESFGMILEAARLCGLPISYVTTGQEVPDDMEAARPERLARMVLGAGVEVGR